ncbi:MFS transporter [Armatimonas rosea]|uniref:MFS family permease n=1 Tax=Armatimonas rosea TaxID=685828 RepID=A0A7W9SN17_ARMRO|nr:MFS transporter [Armatimonas rosea]MBB6049345.1 MFS family permease [Armatimonas rosea]
MPDGRKPHLLWWVVFLLAPVALLNYLDRQMLSAMKFSVMGELRDIGSDTRWGIMLAQFKWVYACLSPVGGYLADRFSRRGIIVGSLAVWSAITWWTGQATSYSELLWARTLMGVSEAFYIPAALALLMDYHTGATKSRATGIHMAAIYLGVILGGFAGYVADAPGLGWRWAFHTAGAVGIVYALPLWLLLKDPPRTGESAPRNSPLGALKQLLRNPSFLLLTLYFALIAWPGWMMKDWMPAMLKSQFELSQGRAGVSAGLYVNLAGFVGLFLGGLWADRWVRKSVRGRTTVSAIGMGLIIPALFGLGYSPSIGVAIGFLALFGLGFGLFDGNNMPILSQLVRPDLRATGYGVMNFVSVSLGGFADIGVGRLRDSGASFAGILSLTACAVAVNVLLVLLIRPRPELTPELERV